MKKLFLVLLIIAQCSFFVANAQVFNNTKSQIGINEHLGKTIPLGLKFCDEKGDSVTLAQLVDKPKPIQQQFFEIQLLPWFEFLRNKFLWKDCSYQCQPDPDPGNFSEELSHLSLKICSH